MNENDNITHKETNHKYEQADKEIIVKDQKGIEKSIVKSKREKELDENDDKSSNETSIPVIESSLVSSDDEINKTRDTGFIKSEEIRPDRNSKEDIEKSEHSTIKVFSEEMTSESDLPSDSIKDLPPNTLNKITSNQSESKGTSSNSIANNKNDRSKKNTHEPQTNTKSLEYHGEVAGPSLENVSWEADFSTIPISSEDLSENNVENIRGISTIVLTESEMELCHIIDSEYDRSLESLKILLASKYASFRQSAFYSILFFCAYLIAGTLFYSKNYSTHWNIEDSLLFSIYTITTVGYGNHYIPATAGFQIFTIFYILVGIAALTIAVAQAYSWVALETARAQFAKDKAEIKKKIRKNDGEIDDIDDPNSSSSLSSTRFRRRTRYLMERYEIDTDKQDSIESFIDFIGKCYDKSTTFLATTSTGRVLSVILPLLIAVLIGAIVVAPIEGWSFMEGIYWAVVSLTTVGYGQYHPTKTASIWFCIFYLPISIGFMSYFLANVARFYIHMNNSNIARIQRRMWTNLLKEKEKNSREQNKAAHKSNSDDESDGEILRIPQDQGRSSSKRMPEGYDSLADDPNLDMSDHSWLAKHSGTTIQDGLKRREKVIEIQRTSYTSPNKPIEDHETIVDDQILNEKEKMTTMKIVVNAVKLQIQQDKQQSDEEMPSLESSKRTGNILTPEITKDSRETLQSKIFSKDKHEQQQKPSFPLRVLVQERLAHIIAHDIAGYQSMAEIDEKTLSITVDTFKFTADKWMIPRKARKAFQSVSFEALFFVGERNLILHGADALLDLGPLEFHGLFSGFLAAMGDADTMKAWLDCTSVLSDVEFKKGLVGSEKKRGVISKEENKNTLPRMVMKGGNKSSRSRKQRRKENAELTKEALEREDRSEKAFEIV